jgi:hypothetical protein
MKQNVNDADSSKRNSLEEASDPNCAPFKKSKNCDPNFATSLLGEMSSAPIEKASTLSPEQQTTIDACFSPEHHQSNRIVYWSSPNHFRHKLLVEAFNASVEIEDVEVGKALALLAEIHFMPGGDENMDTYYGKKEEYWAVLEKGRKKTESSESADVWIEDAFPRIIE